MSIKHLSVAIMRKILSSTDLNRVAAMDESFARGLRLFAPELGVSSASRMAHIVGNGYMSLGDCDYRFISALYCATQGIPVGPESDWVPDDVAAVSSFAGNAQGDEVAIICGWSKRHSELTEPSEPTLVRLNRLSPEQADFLIRSLKERSVSHLYGNESHMSVESYSAAKMLTLDLLLFMAEHDGHKAGTSMGELIRDVPWFNRIESMTGLSVTDPRHQEVKDAVRDALCVSGVALYFSAATLLALLSMKSSPARLTEVIHRWAEVFNAGGDYIPLTIAGVTYLSESVPDEEDVIPFTWWMNLNVTPETESATPADLLV